MAGSFVKLSNLEVFFCLLQRDSDKLPAEEVFFAVCKFRVVVEGGVNKHAGFRHFAAIVVGSTRAQVLADDGQFHGLWSQFAVGVPLMNLGKIVVCFGEIITEKLDATT